MLRATKGQMVDSDAVPAWAGWGEKKPLLVDVPDASVLGGGFLLRSCSSNLDKLFQQVCV